MSNCWGKGMYVEIFLDFFECSKRLKWKQTTMGNFFIVNCFVDSWYVWHWLHFIFASLPSLSGLVNLLKHSISDLGTKLSSWWLFSGAGWPFSSGGVGSGVDAADAPELLLPLLWSTFPRSREISQNGSMVVETHLYNTDEVHRGQLWRIHVHPAVHSLPNDGRESTQDVTV